MTEKTTSVSTQVRAAVKGMLSGTPGRMRLLGAVSALAAVVFGAATTVNLTANEAAVTRAAATTAQVVRVQGLYADLLLADATATNAFLVGGLEKPEQRAAYDQAIQRATTGIAEAASAEPADGTALAALNTTVQTYVQLVEQARAYNRQGLPVGAQYLKLASAGLRSDALPILDAVTAANTARSGDELGRSAWTLPLILGGLLSLAVFGYVLVWFARRTHRYVNVPLAAGALGLGLVLVIGLTMAGRAGAKVNEVRRDQLAAAVTLANARAAAYDAKSNESLTLIARGSGGAFEASWKAQSDKVVADLEQLGARPSGNDTSTALRKTWSAYVDAHQSIRKTDDGGGWDRAVDLASATGDGTANAAFADFDKTASAAVNALGAAVTDRLGEARGGLNLTAWALLALTVASAVAALRGANQRIEEYR
jgi:hypothetical protein